MDKPLKPTPLESQILAVLWKTPGVNVRQVNETLSDGKARAYTTVLSALQVMEGKGLVVRKREGLTDHWCAAVDEDAVARPMLKNLVRQILGGRRKLALQYLLDDESISKDELDELQVLIDEAKKRAE